MNETHQNCVFAMEFLVSHWIVAIENVIGSDVETKLHSTFHLKQCEYVFDQVKPGELYSAANAISLMLHSHVNLFASVYFQMTFVS